MKTQELYTRTWRKLLDEAQGENPLITEGKLKDACDYAKRVFGPAHPHVYESLTKLAEHYLGRGRFITADRFYQQAFDVLLQTNLSLFTPSIQA